MNTANIVSDILLGSAGSYPGYLTAVGDTLFFTANDGKNGTELWKTDGTTTTLVSDIFGGGFGSNPRNLTAVGDTLFFTANDGKNGTELWKTDGTTTTLVSDIFGGVFGSYPGYLTAVGDTLFFTANDGTNGTELWKTDGTTTTLVSDIYGGPSGSNPRHLTAVGDTLFFTAYVGIYGRELWKTDGTTTTLVSDINDGPSGSNPEYLTAAGNTLFFTANDGKNGTELWKTDGTTTTLVSDINDGPSGSNPRNLTAVGDTVFFTANDGKNGTELWKTDGTTTTLVSDINDGPSGSNPRNLTAVGDTVFFTAYVEIYGRELWKTDGTTTMLVSDIYGGPSDSYPYYLTAVGNYLFFTANDGESGYEIWKTDGETTTRVTDLESGGQSDWLQYLTVLGNTLFFTAADDINGRELWSISLISGPTFSINAINPQQPEGGAGEATVFSFEITLSEALEVASRVSWALQLSGGSGGADSGDFSPGQATSGVLTFNPGELSKTISISVSGDLTVEPDETFQVVLSAAEGASLGTATATATILNDDTAFSIVGANSIQKEGNSGTTPFSFTVQREGSTVGAASVDWTVSASGGDPASASDFVGGTFPKGTVAFADGEDSKTITIDVLADSEVEADESFTVSLTNPVGGSINTASAVGTILNDDTTLSITALNADQPEGDSGTTAFTFTVSRAGDTSGTSSATWSVSGSGAHPADAADFGGSLPTGTVTFAPGVSTQTITIQVTGDTTVEPGEEFTVTLTDASGATLAQASATGTIQDDDLKAIELQLAGGVKLSFVLDSAPAEFGTEGLGVLQGRSSTVQSLYGLSDVSITVDSVANGVASISGSGQWAGKAVAFSGKLGASGNTYTLSDVSGSLDLGTWLGSSTHFRNHVNGQLSLNSTDPTTPQFVVQGVAEVWLDPDSATRAQAVHGQSQ
jgi:ELWxxDGT repeat protein